MTSPPAIMAFAVLCAFIGVGVAAALPSGALPWLGAVFGLLVADRIVRLTQHRGWS